MSRERNGLSKESEVPGESGKEKTGSGRGAAGPDREADTAAILAPLADDPRTLRMKRFIQHGRITTYDHCMAVARLSDRIDRTLHLHSHRSDLIRGAFLHDYYLYDWHVHGDRLHGFHHPAIACSRVSEDFDLDEREKKIIRSHMWPLTLLHAPTCREAVIVCIADKVCSTKETLFCR